MKNLFPLILLSLVILFSSCGVGLGTQQAGSRNQQAANLKNNFRVSEGMSKDEVYQIMGEPAASEFDGGVEEWHYCATGIGADKFVAFYFNDGMVVSKTSYSVTLADVGGVTGHCSNFIKRGTYQMPEVVLELRKIIQ